jgi:predicted transposase YbfD/YdcC
VDAGAGPEKNVIEETKEAVKEQLDELLEKRRLAGEARHEELDKKYGHLESGADEAVPDLELAAERLHLTGTLNLDNADAQSVIKSFAQRAKALQDPRNTNKIKFTMSSVCVGALLALLAGCCTLASIADFMKTNLFLLRQFEPCFHGAPSKSGLQKILALIKADEAYNLLFHDFLWKMRRFIELGKNVAQAFDEKAVRPFLKWKGEYIKDPEMTRKFHFDIYIRKGKVMFVSTAAINLSKLLQPVPLGLLIFARMGDINAKMMVEAIRAGCSFTYREGDSKAYFKAGRNLAGRVSILSFDGRKSKGSKRKRHGARRQDAVNTLDICGSEFGMNIRQVTLEAEKSSEITGVKCTLEEGGLFDPFTLYTADALNAQKAIVDKVVASGGMYVVPIKDNHKNLSAKMESMASSIWAFDSDVCAPAKGVGHTRRYDKKGSNRTLHDFAMIDAPDGFEYASQWKKLTRLGFERIFTSRWDGSESEEFRFYLVSDRVDVELFARACRTHWQVENRVHWILDAVYKDDNCRITAGRGSEGLQALRKIAMCVTGFARYFYMPIKEFEYKDFMRAINFGCRQLQGDKNEPDDFLNLDSIIGLFSGKFIYGSR